MTPEELAAEAAIFMSYDKPMSPHPHGLRGRALDALTDAELLEATPATTTPAAIRSARALADALSAALRAEG